MKQFSQLVYNEHIKIFKKTGTKVMFLILLGIVIIGGLFTRLFAEDIGSEPWRERVQNEISVMEQQMQEADLPPETQIQIQEQIELQEYYLSENIEPLTNQHTWEFFIDNGQLVTFIAMFTVIVAAGIIAGEHSSGTIKMLLIRPVKRWKILLSKWTATMLFSFIVVFALMIYSFIVGLFFSGFNLGPLRWIDTVHGEIRDWHVLEYGILVYSLNFIELLMLTTFAFMIGTVFRNQSLAIGLSLVALFMGGQVVFLLNQFEWAKYILFANTYLMQYVHQSPIVAGMTPLFSAIILIVYFAAFMLISILIFAKRDVAD